jgi:hypothetical protein
LVGVVSYLGATPTFGGIVISGPAAGNHIHQLVIPPDGDTVTLNPDPVTYLAGATAAMKVALAADFPAWTFTYAAGLNGTLNIDQYKATSAGPHNGGGLLELTYTRATTDPAITDLHWIQMVVTNVPLGGGPITGYIDPRPNDDTLPFYWTLVEDGQPANGNKTATTYHFFDNSSRNLHTPNFITWRGDLMLASWNGADPGNVTVYDGIRWGWDLQAVPEPSSLVMFLVGCFGIGLHRARCKRRHCIASGAHGQ